MPAAQARRLAAGLAFLLVAIHGLPHRPDLDPLVGGHLAVEVTEVVAVGGGGFGQVGV